MPSTATSFVSVVLDTLMPAEGLPGVSTCGSDAGNPSTLPPREVDAVWQRLCRGNGLRCLRGTNGGAAPAAAPRLAAACLFLLRRWFFSCPPTTAVEFEAPPTDSRQHIQFVSMSGQCKHVTSDLIAGMDIGIDASQMPSRTLECAPLSELNAIVSLTRRTLLQPI